MAYIGSPVQQVLSRPTSQSFNGDGSTTVFTLNRSVNVSEELEVFVSNVQQEPGVGKSYTANGTSLTFDEAPPSGTGNIYVIYRGLAEVTRVLEHHPNNPLAATTGTFSDDVFLYRADGLNFSKIVNPEGAANVSPLEFHVGGGMAIHIDNSTNVGIGTTDPGAKLEVVRGSAPFAAIFGAPQGSGRAVLFKDNHASPNRYNYLIGSQYNINNGFEITPSTAVGGTTFSNPAIAILETGRIGIGTNSPGRQLEITDGNSGKIRASGPDGGMIECWNGSHGVYFGSGSLVTGTGNSQDSVIFVEGGGSQRYYTSGYERMRIDSGGKVGIGTTTNTTHSLFIHNSDYQQLGLSGNTPTIWLKETDGNANENYQIRLGNGALQFQTQNDAQTGAVSRVIFDSSGSVRINATSDVVGSGEKLSVATGSGSGGIGFAGTSGTILRIWQQGSGGGTAIQFYSQPAGNFVGSITVTTSATSYNTSSDYRLKENVTATWDATTRLKQLNPVRFNFIANADNTVDGFLAHEVQAVVPEAVTGTHNEVDDDGNPVYQGIDQSKLVPLLVKTIQELEARITALENN